MGKRNVYRTFRIHGCYQGDPWVHDLLFNGISSAAATPPHPPEIALVEPGLVHIEYALALAQEPQQLHRELLSQNEIPLGVALKGDLLDPPISKPHFLSEDGAYESVAQKLGGPRIHTGSDLRGRPNRSLCVDELICGLDDEVLMPSELIFIALYLWQESGVLFGSAYERLHQRLGHTILPCRVSLGQVLHQHAVDYLYSIIK